MKTQDVIEHFGSKTELAKALGVSSAAISQWGDEPPKLRQHEIQRITDGKFKVDSAPDLGAEPVSIPAVA